MVGSQAVSGRTAYPFSDPALIVSYGLMAGVDLRD